MSWKQIWCGFWHNHKPSKFILPPEEDYDNPSDWFRWFIDSYVICLRCGRITY